MARARRTELEQNRERERYTPAEVAQITGVSLETLARLEGAGLFPHASPIKVASGGQRVDGTDREEAGVALPKEAGLSPAGEAEVTPAGEARFTLADVHRVLTAKRRLLEGDNLPQIVAGGERWAPLAPEAFEPSVSMQLLVLTAGAGVRPLRRPAFSPSLGLGPWAVRRALDPVTGPPPGRAPELARAGVPDPSRAGAPHPPNAGAPEPPHTGGDDASQAGAADPSRTEDALEPLRRFEPFANLTEATLGALAGTTRIRRFPAGSWLFRQGQPLGGDVYLLIEGEVELLSGRAAGANPTERAGPGALLGEGRLLGQRLHGVSARACTDCACALIPWQVMHWLVEESGLAGWFGDLVAARLGSLYGWLVQADGDGRTPAAYERQLLARPLAQAMSSPVATIDQSEPVIEAARRMSDRRIGSLVVTQDGRAVGILTEGDVIRHVVAAGRDPGLVRTGEVMQAPLLWAPRETACFDALLLMIEHRIKHLAVSPDGLHIEGMVTARDLLETPTARSLGRLRREARPGTEASPAELLEQGEAMVRNLVAEGISAHEAGEVAAALYDRLVGEVLRRAEERLLEDPQFGCRPPVAYCWLQLGSAGRREQVLRTDQDNALVYADPPAGEEQRVRAYFARLARLAVEGLERLGFPRCPGQVMASNPALCRSVSEWERQLRLWAQEAVRSIDVLRLCGIFLDLRPAYGEGALGRTLASTAGDLFRASPEFVSATVREYLGRPMPPVLAGGLRTFGIGSRRGELDLKAGGLVHLVDGARLLALEAGVRDTSTFWRLSRCAQLGALPAAEASLVQTAFEALSRLRIRAGLEHQGRAAPNRVSVRDLQPHELLAVRESLLVVRRLREWIARRFPTL